VLAFQHVQPPSLLRPAQFRRSLLGKSEEVAQVASPDCFGRTAAALGQALAGVLSHRFH
jgi:hypothetical protein